MKFLRSIAETVEMRFTTVQRLFQFLIERKMWWLIPMVLVLVVGFILILLAQSSPVGPFIYTLF